MCTWEDHERPVVCPDCEENNIIQPLSIVASEDKQMYCSLDWYGRCPRCSITFPVRYRLDQDYDADDAYEWEYKLPN